jgi:hypothetical protein
LFVRVLRGKFEAVVQTRASLALEKAGRERLSG